MTTTTLVRPVDPALRAALRLAGAFAVVKLLLQFALTLWSSHLGYGYFRDEFYYIACGRHLAWGFVDHGPVVAVQARLGEILFGESVFGIRLLSAVAGAITVFLTGLLAWSMQGRRSAQALAMLGMLCSPQYIGVDGFLSMNSFEPVFWMLCALALFLVLRGYAARLWWTVFGISAGIGLLNKPSMTFFLLALGVGLLCTPARRILFTRYAALGVVLFTLIALPNLLWQVQNHWPTLEFLRNGRDGGKNAVLGPLQFFMAQFAMLGPLSILLWLTGLVALLRQRSIKAGRWFGITYLAFYIFMDAIHAKDYYLEGIYPALFAAGAIAWEHRYATSRAVQQGHLFAFPVLETVLVLTSALILPMASPVLRPADWVRYTTALHLRTIQSETSATGPLPQFFADRFIWNEQVALVDRAFRTLTPAEQQRVCIFGSNYGEAGAIDFLGRLNHLGFPPALSGQNSYWTWGIHGCDTNLVIALIHDTPEELAAKFQSVTLIGNPDAPYAMPFERRRHVYLLRDRMPTSPFHWEDERFYY